MLVHPSMHYAFTPSSTPFPSREEKERIQERIYEQVVKNDHPFPSYLATDVFEKPEGQLETLQVPADVEGPIPLTAYPPSARVIGITLFLGHDNVRPGADFGSALPTSTCERLYTKSHRARTPTVSYALITGTNPTFSRTTTVALDPITTKIANVQTHLQASKTSSTILLGIIQVPGPGVHDPEEHPRACIDLLKAQARVVPSGLCAVLSPDAHRAVTLTQSGPNCARTRTAIVDHDNPGA
ncbi:hypothetical protein V8E53_000141 [Lactarius tabidus]